MMGSKFAIIIAIEEYHQSKFTRVHYARNDAAAFKEALDKLGFNSVWIFLDADATKAAMYSQILRAANSLTEEDTLFFYYAGHGFSENGYNYITCHDTLYEDLINTSMPLQEIFNFLNESPCRKRVMFLDSCHSGMPVSDMYRDVVTDLQDDSLESLVNDLEYCVCFSSCRENEKSYSSDVLKHGIWSYHLINALGGDVPKILMEDNLIRCGDLQDHLNRQVKLTLRKTFREARSQTASLFGRLEENFVVADVNHIIEARRLALASAMTTVKNVFFKGSALRKIKELSGFRPSHTVPKEIASYTQDFVARISEDDVKIEIDELFGQIRRLGNYKRRDIETHAVEGTGEITTPDFTFKVTYRQNPDDPSEVLIETELGELSSALILEDSVVSEVLSGRFNSVVFQFVNPIDIEDVVDAIEDLDDDAIDVDGPPNWTFCEISIAGQHEKIIVTPDEFCVKYTNIQEPKLLVAGLQYCFKSLSANKVDLPILPAVSRND